jgi:hypothetical protein
MRSLNILFATLVGITTWSMFTFTLATPVNVNRNLDVFAKSNEGEVEQAHTQNDEVVQFIDTGEPISARDDEVTGPPPPWPEQFCCDQQCGMCSYTSCLMKDCGFWVRLRLF